MLDLLMKRGKVVDGTGAAARVADVAVRDGRIVEVGDLPDAKAQRVIDCSGKVVAPGFIDIHSHNEMFAIRDDYVTLFEPYLRQGITTSVVSNCGWSLAPWLPDNSRLFHSTLAFHGRLQLLRAAVGDGEGVQRRGCWAGGSRSTSCPCRRTDPTASRSWERKPVSRARTSSRG